MSGAGKKKIVVPVLSFSTPSGQPSSFTPTAEQYADRAAGAIVGSIIGDALGVGAHWYYNQEQMKERYGTITHYVTPCSDWYHQGEAAGTYSQTAQAALLVLDALLEAEDGAFHRADYTAKLDALLDELDADDMPFTGKSGYSDRAMRDLYDARKKRGVAWDSGETGSWTDTSEASQHAVMLAARYAYDESLNSVAVHAEALSRVLYQNPSTVTNSIAFTCVLALLIRGVSLDEASLQLAISSRLRRGLHSFSTIVKLDGMQDDEWKRADHGTAPSVNNPDALLGAVTVLRAMEVTDIATLQPPEKAVFLYGQNCQVNAVHNSAYYYARRYVPSGDFSAAICAAQNAGGQTLSRVAHVGALMGAAVGLSAIPRRWIDGLEHGAHIERKAKRLADIAARDYAKTL